MKKIILILLVGIILSPSFSDAQTNNKVYYGMSLGFNFGSYFRIRVAPMVGYRITPQFSAGVKAAYEYIKDNRYNDAVTYHNYGGSLFARYLIIPQLYVHAEYAYMSYQFSVSDFNSEREGIPFLLLGGGYRQRIGKNTFAFLEVLFDVLQNEKSPYEAWEPLIIVGVSTGF